MSMLCASPAFGLEFSNLNTLGGPYEYEVDAGTYRTPTTMVKEANYPIFSDDYDLRGMKLAIARQLVRFKSKSLTGKIIMGGVSYPLTKVKTSLETFNEMIDAFEECVNRQAKDRCYEEFNAAIRQKFYVFKPLLTSKDPRYGKENFAMFTGYNTHRIEGRLQPDAEFKHAIYAHPKNTKFNGKTRVQIDFDNALAGRGLEIVYVKNLFDVYMMHVQGSGRITVNNPDGTANDFFLQYDGTNKQRWAFISLYMAKKGYIVNGSIPSQRKFMRENPDKEREIYGYCPSYIYTKATPNVPKGSDVVPVTDGRTIAQDNAFYPFKGLLAYIESERPVENGNYNQEEELKSNVPFMPFSRFFIDQDTGGAINGKARVDIYFGSDEYAMFAAMYQHELGKIHFLLLK
ncbi:MAG: MltA domain-containing protein [Bdellovibrionales bacterium]|nr:MltA domain-containing protein [Bdellovibrionales bacterium]